MSKTDIDLFRILVADNEPQVHDAIAEHLSGPGLADRLLISHAKSEDETIQAYRDHYIDLLLLDLSFREGDQLSGGIEVLEALGQLRCTADVILMTHVQPGESARSLIQAITRSSRPNVLDIVGKEGLDVLPRRVSALLDSFEMKAVALQGLDLATDLVAHRRDRYVSGSKPRTDSTELAVEIERLCRDLFGKIDGFRRSTSVSVDLMELDRIGLSAAATLKPIVHLGFGQASQFASGYDCVLKLGPVDEIGEEYARYQEFVRYGVQLDQRVELLAFAARDFVAGIVYSFAGGAYGKPLASLDELLISDTKTAAEVLSSLFESHSWYSVEAPREAIRGYVEGPRNPKANLGACLTRNGRSLSKLKHGIHISVGEEGGDSALEIPGAPILTLPGKNFLGEGWSLVRYPWCLVHGDMHGGNVMVTLPSSDIIAQKHSGEKRYDRVCLIDYSNAGPGPRCVDALALEASIRFTDAERLGDGLVDSVASGGASSSLQMLQKAAQRLDAEYQFYRRLWRGEPVPSAEWSSLALHVVDGLRHSFREEVTQVEYLQTGILYSIRQLGFEMHPLLRVRTCAWLAAQYRLFKELDVSLSLAES